MAEPNSIHARWRARCSASAGCSRGCSVSSRYSQITADSKIGVSPTSSTGVLPSGDTARNQSGLFAKSTSRRVNGTRFSASTMAARCT